MRSLGLSLTAAMALVVLGTTGGRVCAQMNQFAPPLSPYLNLLRPGTNPGINWGNLVVPEMELYNASNQLAYGQNTLGQAISGGGNTALGMTTGHPVMFGPNYLWYYPMRGGMGMGGMGMGGMGMGGMGGGMGGMGMGGMGMGMGGMGMGMGGMGMGMGGMGMGMGGMGMGMGGMGMGMGGMGMGMGGMYR